MLLQLSTLLTRARRRKILAPCFITSVPEIMLGIAQSAATQPDCGVILCIPQNDTHPLPFASRLQVALSLATQSRASIAVVAITGADRESIEQALALHAPCVSLIAAASSLSRHSLTELTTWAVTQANKEKKEVVGALTGLVTPARLEEFVRVTGVSALSLQIGVFKDEKVLVSPDFLHQLVNAATVPVIAQELPLTSSLLHQCARSGLVGFSVSEILEEAYTAGLRTGLRSRSCADPSRYQLPAIRAVQNAVNHYLTIH